MRKTFFGLIVVIFGIAYFTDASARQDSKKKIRLRKPDIVDIVWVNYNNWSYVMQNNGSYMYDLNDIDHDGKNFGGIFPRGSGISLVGAGGFYIGTLKDGIPVVSETEYSTEFQPGKIINSDVIFDSLKAEDPMLLSNKVYLIDRDQRSDWPEEAQRDKFGKPALIADAQTWAVFNDLDISMNSESEQESPTPGLGIEVTLESYAFNGPRIGDVVYLRFILENKTNNDYPQTYFGIWSDPDVEPNTIDNLVGTDTVRNMEFVYNCFNEIPEDRAVGFDFMQGPVVQMTEIPQRDRLRNRNNRTILKYDSEENRFISEALENNLISLSITSSWARIQGVHPRTNTHRYNALQGRYHWSGIMLSGCGLEDYFAFRGNPLTEQGTCDVAGLNNPKGGFEAMGVDQRILLNTGPFTIKAGESQEIWVGVVGAAGTDRLDAVANLWETDDFAQSFFDQGFPAPSAPPRPNLSVTASDKHVVLTWDDNAESYLDSSGEKLGVSAANGFSADYVINDFQGYRVYRSLTGLQDSYELLAQYDKIDSFGSVINRYLNENNHLEIMETQLGNNTGLQYAFIDSDLVNGQNYFYSVTAYDAQPYIAGPDTMIYDGIPILKPAGLPVTLESSLLANAVSAVPAKPAVNSSLKNIKVVPNPFYKYSSYETSFDKLIKFTNLPSTCTIKIFTVAGDLIKTIKHNSTSDNDRVNTDPYDETFEPESNATSIERWDLKTENGRYVASGI